VIEEIDLSIIPVKKDKKGITLEQYIVLDEQMAVPILSPLLPPVVLLLIYFPRQNKELILTFFLRQFDRVLKARNY